MKRTAIFLSLIFLSSFKAFALENIVDLFKNNQAIIYAINIRNFGATDKDNDGIINPEKGDTAGTFLNAKDRLPSLKKEGINTIYLLPITKTGKLKALGTAGSLYAMDSFDEINPQLDDKSNPKSVYEEAKEFVNYAHSLGLNVIVDLPSCASYDLSLKKPEWFMFDSQNNSLTPADWTDVRLLKVYNDDNKTLDDTMLNNFKRFVDLTLDLDFDGIRADVAAIKPYAFWKNIIDYTKAKKPNFIFLAEANPEWTNPAPNGIFNYASVDELLNAGFDSYYGSFSDFKNITAKKEFDKKAKDNLKILKKHKNKSIIGAFATHDQQAPVLKSKNYWNTVLWLNILMPLNSYFLDGFSVGDDYTYSYENKKANKTLTDDEYYFVHSGMFDIFNLTAPVRNKHPKFKKEYLKAISFKNENKDFLTNSDFKLLKTGNDSVFAFSREYKNEKVIVVASLDDNNIQKAVIDEKKLKKEHIFNFINGKQAPKTDKAKINATLEAGELQVYFIKTKI